MRLQSIDRGYVDWLIERDRKSTGLKSLQGKIWRQGYVDGSLKSQVYADVAPALERWRAQGLSINIFSSGSVLAQQLLFAHTEAGDLTKFIDNYFDTNVGKKGEAESYRRIAEALRLRADEVLFISDVVAELDAATEAGMSTLLSIRPGNPPQNNADRYRDYSHLRRNLAAKGTKRRKEREFRIAQSNFIFVPFVPFCGFAED